MNENNMNEINRNGTGWVKSGGTDVRTKENPSRLTMMSFSMMRDAAAKKIDADTVVRTASENGLSMMDIMTYEFDLYGKEELIKALEKYRVSVGCLITGASFYTKPEAEYRAELEKALQQAAELKAPYLMVVPGSGDDSERKICSAFTREELLQKAVNGYRAAVKLAVPFGIRVGFENTPQDFKPLASADDCEYILKQVPGLGLIFDSGNFRVADVNCDELEIYRQLKPYIIRWHLKDVVVGDFESGEGCVNGQKIRCVTTGSGIIPIKDLIHRAIADGYEGIFAVEYAASETVHGEGHITAVKPYLDYIRGCFSGEPLQTIYARIPGIDKPVSRMFYGTAVGPMLKGENLDYVLDAAMSYGINSFDCARGYGRAENSLGRWIKNRNNRDRVIILTKCGNSAWDGSVRVNRSVILKELEESLKALETDYIDIYLLHRDDPNTPVSEFIDTLNEVQKAGKIRVFGVSNWTCDRIEEANTYAASKGLNGFAISSPNFGLADQYQDPWGGNCVTISGPAHKKDRDWYRANQMPVLAYSSLARGMFAGKIRSEDEANAKKILDHPAYKGYACHDNFIRLARCEELSRKTGLSISQIAVGWMFTQGLNLFALASTTNVTRFSENLKALYINLREEEAEWLENVGGSRTEGQSPAPQQDLGDKLKSGIRKVRAILKR